MGKTSDIPDSRPRATRLEPTWARLPTSRTVGLAQRGWSRHGQDFRHPGQSASRNEAGADMGKTSDIPDTRPRATRLEPTWARLPTSRTLGLAQRGWSRHGQDFRHPGHSASRNEAGADMGKTSDIPDTRPR